jgi:hypothetical protein
MDTLALEIKTFKELMAGTLPVSYWMALFVMFHIGAIIYQGVKVSNAIKDKNTTPYQFSLTYYLTDVRNYIDFGIAVLSAYIFVRFADNFIGEKGIANNIEWMMLVCVGLGAGWQFIAIKLMDLLQKLIKRLIG